MPNDDRGDDRVRRLSGAEVLRIVAARTLYDESHLTLDSDLEGELGIDSIILESILGMLGERFRLTELLPMGMTTLRELVAAVEEAVGPDAVVPAAAPAAEQAPRTGARARSRAARRRRERRRRLGRPVHEGLHGGAQSATCSPRCAHSTRSTTSAETRRLYWYGMPLESACRNRAVIYDEVTGRRREF